MKKTLALIAAVAAAPAVAQDFSEGSQAKPWKLFAEQPARFEAKVVDILCEVTGNCADNCGDGNRQLGLVRAVDNVLVYPNKNSQTSFNGASADLLPYCGQDVEVDGLILEDPELGATNVYLVQFIRALDEPEFTKANQWTKAWAERNPEVAEGKGPWFRRDPRVKAAIEAEGYFGLGLDREAEAKKAAFE
ncbi:MAG: hypothetical protein AAFY06_09915 [Pseudomonadota bacterium]